MKNGASSKLVAKAKSMNVTLIGPNSMGVVNVDNGFMYNQCGFQGRRTFAWAVGGSVT